MASSLGGAAVAHLAMHGRVRADNPLSGSLGFADGPLMIYDLEKLERTRTLWSSPPVTPGVRLSPSATNCSAHRNPPDRQYVAAGRLRAPILDV